MSSISRATRQTWTLFGLVVLLTFSLITAVSVAVLFARERSDATAQSQRAATNAENIQASLKCMTDWATAYSQRAAYVQQLADRRVDALDALAHALATPTSNARVQAAVQTYLASSNAYSAGVKAHPVPQAPTLACHIAPFTGTVEPGPTVTLTVPGPTRTVPGPTVHVPGPTVTRAVPVPLPGPTTTVVLPGPPFGQSGPSPTPTCHGNGKKCR